MAFVLEEAIPYSRCGELCVRWVKVFKRVGGLFSVNQVLLVMLQTYMGHPPTKWICYHGKQEEQVPGREDITFYYFKAPTGTSYMQTLLKSIVSSSTALLVLHIIPLLSQEMSSILRASAFQDRHGYLPRVRVLNQCVKFLCRNVLSQNHALFG